MTDANHTLTLVSHSPHALDIQYTSGESCDGHVTWKVNLHIYCSNKNNSKQPYLESSSGCDIRFIWPTSTLCLTEVEVRKCTKMLYLTLFFFFSTYLTCSFSCPYTTVQCVHCIIIIFLDYCFMHDCFFEEKSTHMHNY